MSDPFDGVDLSKLPPNIRQFVDRVRSGECGVMFSLPKQTPGKAVLMAFQDGRSVQLSLDVAGLDKLIEWAKEAREALLAGVVIDHFADKS